MKQALLLLLCLCMAATTTSLAQTTRLIVTSNSDDGGARDASPGDGICEDNSGRCTLRAAVDEANAVGGEVIIVLPGMLPGNVTGTFTLSAVAPNVAMNTYEDMNAYGDLDLNGTFSSLTIQGTGTPGPTITISPNDRILDVGDNRTVRIERVHLNGGTARAGRNGNGDGSGIGVDGEDGADGGGLRVGAGAQVQLDQVTISGCATQSGGNGATPASGIARTAGGDAGDGGDGGAIYIAQGATVSISRSNITQNGTGDAGGAGSGQANGMAADGGAGGDGGNGGAIYNAGSLTVTNSTIYDNSCGDAGAGGPGVNGGNMGSVGAGGAGGGIANAQRVNGSLTNQGSATLTSTIVAGNASGSSQNSGPLPGLDLFDASMGGTFSGANDLIGSTTDVSNFNPASSITGTASSPVDPVITGLNQNSDWAVPTLVLGPTSPALGAGSSSAANDYDARGFQVPGGNTGPEIGAYEINSSRIPQDVTYSEVDVKTSTGDGEFVELANKGNYAVQLDDYAIVCFDDAGNACFTANLYGELAPGELYTVGDSDVNNVDQALDLDIAQNACGSSMTDQLSDGDGAIAIYFGTAANLSGIAAGSQPSNRKDAIVFGPSNSSATGGSGQSSRQAMFDFCSAFGQGAGCGVTDPGDGASIQRDANDDLYVGAPSPGEINTGQALPVDWLGVSAHVDLDGEAILSWATANEVNVASFTAQRLERGEWLDGPSTSARAAGGNSTQTYSLNLGVLAAGDYALRVSQADFDGQRSYSSIVNLRVDGRGGISVAPNPVRDRLTIQGADAVDVTIVDLAGRTVFARALESGSTVQSIDLTDLRSGTYYLRLTSGSDTRTEQLTKL